MNTQCCKVDKTKQTDSSPENVQTSCCQEVESNGKTQTSGCCKGTQQITTATNVDQQTSGCCKGDKPASGCCMDNGAKNSCCQDEEDDCCGGDDDEECCGDDCSCDGDE